MKREKVPEKEGIYEGRGLLLHRQGGNLIEHLHSWRKKKNPRGRPYTMSQKQNEIYKADRPGKERKNSHHLGGGDDLLTLYGVLARISKRRLILSSTRR